MQPENQLMSTSFQFHKGTIRTGKNKCTRSTHQYFNSIKVRLELSHDVTSNVLWYLFQFHKGTIRTIAITNVNRTIFNFNSIKVRLERTDEGLEHIANLFQFYKGTIRTLHHHHLRNIAIYISIP